MDLSKGRGLLSLKRYRGSTMTVEKAMSVAKEQHKGQKDYGGKDYFKHHIIPEWSKLLILLTIQTYLVFQNHVKEILNV